MLSNSLSIIQVFGHTSLAQRLSSRCVTRSSLPINRNKKKIRNVEHEGNKKKVEYEGGGDTNSNW